MVRIAVAKLHVVSWIAGMLLLGCGDAVMQTASPTGAVAGTTAGAQAAFETALRGYEKENLAPLEALLPQRFIGRSLLLEAAKATLNEQQQIRITLGDVRVQPGTGPAGGAALSARWDKRFLKLPALTPTAETGVLQAVFHLESGQWVMDSLSPDNPFTR